MGRTRKYRGGDDRGYLRPTRPHSMATGNGIWQAGGEGAGVGGPCQAGCPRRTRSRTLRREG